MAGSLLPDASARAPPSVAEGRGVSSSTVPLARLNVYSRPDSGTSTKLPSGLSSKLVKPRSDCRIRSRRAFSSGDSCSVPPASSCVGVSSSRVLPVATSNSYSRSSGELAVARRNSTDLPSGVGTAFSGRPSENPRVLECKFR